MKRIYTDRYNTVFNFKEYIDEMITNEVDVPQEIIKYVDALVEKEQGFADELD